MKLFALLALGCGSVPPPPPPVPPKPAPPPPPLELTVKVGRWFCSVHYADDVAHAELHLPTDRRVIVTFESVDLAHDIVVDGQTAHVDRDAPATLELVAPGTWTCPTDRAPNDPPAETQPIALDYATWLPLEREAQHPTTRDGKLELAKQLYVSKGCAACHSLDGTPRVGPSWKGVWGTTVKSNDGTERTFDLAFVRESVLTPQAFIANGYPATMPSFEGTLTLEQIDVLATFIESLAGS